MPSIKPKLQWIDILRFLCAVEIVGFHWLRGSYKLGSFGCPASLNPVMDYKSTGLGWHGLLLSFHIGCAPYPMLLMNRLLGFLFGYGWEAVSIFILISGFSLTLHLPEDRGRYFWRRWYAGRLRRVLVPYYEIAFPLVTLFLLILRIHHAPGGFGERLQLRLAPLASGSGRSIYLGHLFLVDIFHGRQASLFTPAWWFVPAILIAYLCFPLFTSLMRAFGRRGFLAFAFTLTAASYGLAQHGFLADSAWYFIVTNEAFSFALGIAAASCWKDSARRTQATHLLTSPLTAITAVGLVIAGNLFNGYHALYPYSTAVFTVGLATLGIQVARVLARSDAMRRLASVDAFRLYLVHQPFVAPFAMILKPIFGAATTAAGLPIFLVFVYLLAKLLGRFAFFDKSVRRIAAIAKVPSRVKPLPSRSLAS